MSSPYITLLSVTIGWSILNFLTTLIPCLSSNHVNWCLEQDQILNICRLIRCDRTWCRNIDCTVIIQCTGIPKQNNFLLDDDIGTLRGLYASLTRRGKNVVKCAARKYRKRNDFRDYLRVELRTYKSRHQLEHRVNGVLPGLRSVRTEYSPV